MQKIKIKKLNKNATTPKYAHEGDKGMDLTAISMRETEFYIEYGTGLAFELPKGHAGLIFPRSSISKKDLVLANSIGLCDEAYTGEYLLRFKRLGPNVYEVGDKIGQLVVVPIQSFDIEEVEQLEQTDRGSGGFGSTGN